MQKLRLVEPEGGNLIAAGANRLNIMVAAGDTGGSFELIEETCQPGFVSRMHKHDARSQTFYIIEGSAEVIVGAKSFTAEQGACVHVPPGVPHQIESGGGMKMLMVFSPGGMEALFQAVEDLTPEQKADPEFTKALSASHDTIMMDSESKGTVLG